MLVISVSENFLVQSDFVCLFVFVCLLQNKICLYLRQSICIYVSYSFLMKQVELILVICLLSFYWGMVV